MLSWSICPTNTVLLFHFPAWGNFFARWCARGSSSGKCKLFRPGGSLQGNPRPRVPHPRTPKRSHLLRHDPPQNRGKFAPFFESFTLLCSVPAAISSTHSRLQLRQYVTKSKAVVVGSIRSSRPRLQYGQSTNRPPSVALHCNSIPSNIIRTSLVVVSRARPRDIMLAIIVRLQRHPRNGFCCFSTLSFLKLYLITSK